MGSPSRVAVVAPSDELSRLLEEAQGGNNEARERLIKDYLPFIVKVASKVSKRYLVPGVDDEVAIGMMAFDEAISCYNLKKGASFLSFSEMVVKRRLVDYYRKASHLRHEIPLSGFQEIDEGRDARSLAESLTEDRASELYISKLEEIERKEEVLKFKGELRAYGITLKELVLGSPKHEDARRRAIEVAKVVASVPAFVKYLKEKKSLPFRELTPMVSVSRKTLERQRKYIIAVCIILIEEFVYLREYIRDL